MKKVFIYIILIFTILWLILFLFAYKRSLNENYQFSADTIWKIEQQRREHTYLFPFVAKFIHNKGFYFSYTVFENYLSYYSPSIFFCCNQPLVLELVILLMFYGGAFILLREVSKLVKAILFWILAYPIFLSLMLWPPSLVLALPIIIPASGILVYSLYKEIKFK
ncbi:MAG: hypothetical protein PHE48_02095 [Candidatus Daviesbacteria bacterium]|nr:hypothetical protein [Candidatus Daviesbacteria bacterium]